MAQLMSAGTAFAGSANMTFSGVVTGNHSLQNAPVHSQTIVTFSSQAMLPIIGTSAIIYDGKNKMIGEYAQPRNASQVKSGKFVLVNLGSKSAETFAVCKRVNQSCIRYRVTRL